MALPCPAAVRDRVKRSLHFLNVVLLQPRLGLSVPSDVHDKMCHPAHSQPVTQLRLLGQAPARLCRACTTPSPPSCSLAQSSPPAATRRASMPSSLTPGRACSPPSCALSTTTPGAHPAWPGAFSHTSNQLSVHKAQDMQACELCLNPSWQRKACIANGPRLRCLHDR